MRTVRSLLVVVLFLAAGTSVFYAYQQQKSLRTARLAAEALEKERNDLRKKLWDAQKRVGDLEAAQRSGTGRREGEDGPPPPNAESAMLDAALRAARDDGPGGFGRLMALMDNPEFQKLVATQQKGALDARYAALFRSLNLSPAQLEQFKNLLVEKRTAVADVMAAARSQGLTGRENRDELRGLVQNAQSEVDANIRSVLGDAGFEQYQTFEKTQAQRSVVGQLEQRLSYSGTPLTADQSEALVQVLASNAAANNAGAAAARGPAARGPFGGGAGGAAITDEAITQASAVLTQSQVQALQQLQQEQQAQAQLGQLMREQMRRGRGPATQPAAGTVPPKG